MILWRRFLPIIPISLLLGALLFLKIQKSPDPQSPQVHHPGAEHHTGDAAFHPPADAIPDIRQEQHDLRTLIAHHLNEEARALAGAGEILPPDFIDQSVSGKKIHFTLPDGKVVDGTIDSIEHGLHGIHFVWGRVTSPAPGSFLIQRQEIEGVAGPFVGHIIYDDLDDGWKIEPTEDRLAARFVPRHIDAIVCRGFPAIAEDPDEDPDGDGPLAAPQTHPNNIPLPHYQTVIPLQSLPGATGVIYLDFDGEQGPFPGWGDFDAAPSGASNSQVFQVWQRVAEDFQGFNLNITTDRKVFDEAPAGRKQQIIITPTTNAAPGAGGVAYVGSFNWSTPRPCWSFYTTGKNAAEVISHEIGHTLNLRHHGRTSPSQEYYAGHGSGDVGWAPIMGTGYTRNLTQWSRGEYLNANRSNQDDLAIIVSNNSVAYRADDYGDTLETAGYLEISPNNSVSNEGIIERTGDVDAFRFQTTGGPVNIAVNPVSLGPNLDIHAEIVNAQTLAVIVQNNPDIALNANLSTSLPAGEYLLRVRGTGRGDPLGTGYTNYGSLGSYLITGTVSGGVLPDRFAINENSPNGTAVGTVAPRNNHGAAPITFSIQSGNTGGAFAINSATGQLTVANASVLDFETLSTRWDVPAVITPFISITNPQNPSLNESIRIVVTVNDVNEPPTLSVQSFTMLERTAPDAKLPAVLASDPDRFQQLTFSITGGTGSSVFTINPHSGALGFNHPLTVPESTTYDLQIAVTDSGGLSASETISITVVKHNAPSPPGSIKRLFYTGITGTAVSNLTSNAKFPNNPDSEVDLVAFDGAPWGDNFGSYIRGYFVAPATGAYRFAIASDDGGSLRFAANGNPASTTEIASVSGWTNRYEWTRFASQRSATINLVQGQVCYIEALHKEGTGGDHVAVAFTSPLNADWQVIPGLLLAPHYENSPPVVAAATFQTRSNAIVGSTVGTVQVSDPNPWETAGDFTITSGNPAGLFGIDPDSGRIFVASSLENAAAVHTLTVRTTDSGTPPLQGSGTITIQINPAGQIATSAIIQQIWSGIGGSTVSLLTGSPNYPFNPSSTRLLASGFNSGTNIADNYGSRIRALVIPPLSGSYTFYLSSDDEGRLFMSTSDSPAQAGLIASINNGWSGNLQFDKFSSQTSAPRNLVAGQRYYIETLQKEGGGGDHVQVAWTGPGIASPTIIPASALEPFDINTPPVFAQAFYSFNVNATSPAGTPVGSVAATDPESDPLAYAITSGNINNAFAIDAGGTIRLLDGASIISQSMELTVAAQDSGIAGMYPLKSATATVNLVIDGIENPPGEIRTITFDANGGSQPVPASKVVGVGSPYGTLASVTRTGHSFAGWFTAASGGTPVTPATIVEINADHTLFAQWTANSHTVTFDPNGGNAPVPLGKEVTYGSAYGPLATVTRNGHVFNGWFTAPSGGTEVTPGTIVSIAGDHTLHTQWVRDSNTLTKANNTGTLNTAASWVENLAPDATLTLLWDNTVGGANTADLGGNLAVFGLEVTNPGGAITIGNGAGGRLSVGEGGINLSAATQNLTTNTDLGFTGNQDWPVAGGRTLTLLDLNRNANGSGNIHILQSGSGIANVRMSRNGNNANWNNYSGTITVGANVKVQSEGQHHAAWGSGGITLNGGTIAQNNGTWAWSTPIAVTANSVIATDSSNGRGRSLKLLGNLTSENDSGLTFTNTTTGGTRTDDVGFILAGTDPSTYGTTTISANSRVRVGGNEVNSIQSSGSFNPGTRGSLGTGNVTLAASTAELAFTRTDAHTVANSISGSGSVVIGGNTATMAATASQVLTLSGANTYTGGTRVSRSRLNLTGSLTSAITLDNNASITGTGTTTGRLTMNAGTTLVLAGGETTEGLTVNGVTFNQPVVATFLTDPEPETTYDVLSYGVGGVTNPQNLTIPARGTLVNDTVNRKFTFTAAPLGFTRTWNTTSGTWAVKTGANFIEDDQLFYNGDHVIFGDIASDATITVSGLIAPGSVTVSNTANTYFITGDAITGLGTLTKTGNGTLTLTGATANTHSGLTTVTAGTLRLDKNDGVPAIAGDILVTGSGTLVTSDTRSGLIANTSNVTVDGPDAAFLTGNNQSDTFNVLSVNHGGTVHIGGGGSNLRPNGGITSTGDGSITMSAGGAGLNFNNAIRTVTVDDGTLTISAPIINGGLNVAGAGTLSLAGASSYAGNTTVSDGATLRIAGGGIHRGGYQGSAVLTVSSAATLELQGWNYGESSASLGGLRNNNNAIVIDGGTIRMLGTSAYGRGLTVQSGGATFEAAAGTVWTFDNTGDGNIPFIYNGNPSLTFGGEGTILFNKAFSGNGNLTKTGSGTLVLQGNSAHDGQTVVTEGTLRLTGTLDNTTVSAQSGGTLAGDGNIGGNVVIETGGTHLLAIGKTVPIGGTLTFASGSIVHITSENPPADGVYILASANGGIIGDLSSVNITNVQAGALSIDGNNLVLTIAPPVDDPFADWATTQGLDGAPGKAAGFNDDPDGDGVPNGLEWILGGNPRDGRSGALVATTASAAGGLTLSFTRNPDSLGAAALMVQHNTGLGAAWQNTTIGATSSSEPNGVSVDIDTVAVPHQVTVNIPASHASDGRIFARLAATVDQPQQDAND